MKKIEGNLQLCSEWCKATLNDLLAAENTDVANFIKGCHYAEADSSSGDAEID